MASNWSSCCGRRHSRPRKKQTNPTFFPLKSGLKVRGEESVSVPVKDRDRTRAEAKKWEVEKAGRCSSRIEAQSEVLAKIPFRSIIF